MSKAMSLAWPSYRYIHTILNRSLNGPGVSTGVLSRQELLYLYSMVQSKPLHLGHIVTKYLHHYGQYLRVGVLFASLYITTLIMGMGIHEAIRGTDKMIIPSPLRLVTMRLMGMARKYGPSTYMVIIPLLEESKSKGDEVESSQLAPQP